MRTSAPALPAAPASSVPAVSPEELAGLLAGPSLATSIASVAADVVAWCTPSLRPGAGSPLELSVSTAAMLTADGEPLGEPGDATGPFGRAARLAALAYGADHCLFGVHGSSGQNHVMARVLARAADAHVLLPRNVHHSLVDALVDLGVAFSLMDADYLTELEALRPPSLEQVRRAIKQATTPVTAVVLSSPTYEGLNADVPAIVELAHAHDAVLVVDAAWGAHAPFMRGTPLAPGADMVVTSTHKTAGAQQQTSLLLHRDGRIAWEDVQSAYATTATTSPSFPMLADIDATVRWLLGDGHDALWAAAGRVTRLSDAMRRAFPDLEVLGGSDDVDPLRVTLGGLHRRGVTGYDVAAALAAQGIVVEKRGTTAVTFLAPLQLTDSAVELTATALRRFLAGHPVAPSCPVAEDVFAGAPSHAVLGPAAVARAHSCGLTESVPLEASVGRVAVNRVELYPPGIPLLLPGFAITAAAVAAIIDGAARGGCVASTTGRWDGRVSVVALPRVPDHDPPRVGHGAV